MNVQKNLMRFLVPALLVGCQTVPYQPYARNVQVKPNDSGVIALKAEHRDEDRAKAMEMMASNCGSNGYKIAEEGEVVVGQKTIASGTETRDAGNRQQVGSFFGMPVTSGTGPSKNTETSATTENLREWQMKYDCNKPVAQADATTPKKSKKRGN